MRKLLFRVGVLFGGLFLISFLSNVGIVEKLVNSTVGIVVYWAYLIALALWLLCLSSQAVIVRSEQRMTKLQVCRPLLFILVAVYLIGCTPTSSTPGVDTMKLGLSPVQVERQFGVPDRKTGPDKLGWEDWFYEQPGVKLQFYKGSLFSVMQTGGGIKQGVQVGDPEAKVAALGEPVIEETATQKKVVLPLEGNTEIWILLKEGRVTGFFLVEHGDV